MRAESVIGFPEIDVEAAREFLEVVGDAYFVALAERNGEPVGFITAQPGRYLFSKERFVTHDIFYVAPEARGSRTALLLVQAMEDWAAQLGVKKVFIAVHTGLKPDITGRFYEKLGYRYMGGNYCKDL